MHIARGVRVIIVCAWGLLVGPRLLVAQATTANTEQPESPPVADQIKHPTDWLNWGADLRLREEYFDNAITLDRDVPGHAWDFQRYRARVWTTITPLPDVLDINARLMWEGRHWCDPSSKPEWDNGDALLDNLNAKIKAPGLPLTATLGRQDMIFGDGWLVLEGTPLDGSRTIFFDAARFTLDLKDAKTSVDAVYIRQFSDPDEWIPEINTIHAPLIEQDEQGAILYLTNKSLKNTEADGYVIYKHDERVLSNGDSGDIYTLGTRWVHAFDSHVSGRIEGAYQFGDRNSSTLSAWGLNSRLEYAFGDPLKNQVHVGYEYLSGDDPGTSTNESFDPLWGRWPQFSELYVYTYATETRIAETTNLHRISAGWQAQPTAKLTLTADYSVLLADQNTLAGTPGFSADGMFRGQLVTAVARYQFNRYLAGHLWGEYFFPGDYYSAPRDDAAFYLRAEMTFTL